MTGIVPIIIPVTEEEYDAMCIHVEDLPGADFWILYLVFSIFLFIVTYCISDSILLSIVLAPLLNVPVMMIADLCGLFN